MLVQLLDIADNSIDRDRVDLSRAVDKPYQEFELKYIHRSLASTHY
jgi:hypothetical protein